MASARETLGSTSLRADLVDNNGVVAKWATDRVLLEDRGDVILVRPVPADPIGAARGRFRGAGRPVC
jgi:hypothetical protein